MEAEAEAGEDPRAREGEQTREVRVVDTGSTVGDGEPAGRTWGREWDEAATLRDVSRLLTMTGQSTDGAAWFRAGLGPWLGSLYMYVHER